MNNELMYLSGVDIPFAEAALSVYNPTIKEIGYIGEEDFFAGCNLICSIKKLLKVEDKNAISDTPDFKIFMSIVCDKKYACFKKQITNLFSLLFPNYEVEFHEEAIVLLNKDAGMARINALNFEKFQEIVSTMFCLNFILGKNVQEYNPQGSRAEKIAEKFRKAQEKRLKSKADATEQQGINVLSRYVEVLSLGKPQDINTILNYTVYQLIREYTRFEKKLNFDMNISARLAGAKVDEVDNWMGSIHP